MTSNPNKIISLQELINAQVDVYKLELITNEAPWVEITTRLGRKCYSIATIQAIIDQYKLQADVEIANLTDAINVALAAGAGAAGWIDSLVKTWSGETQEEVNKFNFKQLRSYITASNLIATDQNIINEFISKNKDFLVVDKKLTLSDSMIIDNRLSGKKIVFTPSGLVTWKNGLSFVSADKKALIKFDDNLSDFNIYDPVCDGNKANTTSDVDNSAFGILINNEKVFKNVHIYNPTSRNNRGTGIGHNSGGVSVYNAVTYGNLWHGQGGSFSTEGIAYINNSNNYNNGAYGFDFSKGDFLHDGLLYCENNEQGGSKASVDCKRVVIDTAYLKNNNGLSFRTTGDAPDLNISIKTLHIIDPREGTSAVSIATGKKVDIGELYVNNCSSADLAIRIGDCNEINIGSIKSENSLNRSVYIRNTKGRIGLVSVDSSGGLGLLVDNGAKVNIDTILLKDAGKTGADTNQYGLMVTGASRLVTNSIIHSGAGQKGVNITLSSQLNVLDHDFGLINPTQAVTTSGTGSKYKCASSVGLVSEAFEAFTLSGNGTTTTFTLTLAKPLTSVGGGVYTATVYGNSDDANAAPFTVYQVSQTLVRIRYVTAPPSGTDNLKFNVNVKLEKSIR